MTREEEIEVRFREVGIDIKPERASVLAKYMEEILEKNRSINLTAIREEKEFIQKHYVDSALVTLLPEFQKAEKIVDVGTGAGFPGIPLAVLYPEKEFVLNDSLRKRLDVIREAALRIGIGNIRTVHARAEELGQDPQYREQFDLCVSRAVAELRVLAELCLPLVRPGGCFIAYKGPDSDEEIRQAESAIRTLGGKIDRITDAGSRTDAHRFVVVKKENNTSRKYPRRPGIPSKKPIK
ncbi:MAG: 16S rRNA (guanine(527)-N(7))-methyltransferase RsmG [Anaerovoracaceae bacterium]|jgi:16S rRNA (guanine527-N7)-methyltransferase